MCVMCVGIIGYGCRSTMWVCVWQQCFVIIVSAKKKIIIGVFVGGGAKTNLVLHTVAVYPLPKVRWQWVHLYTRTHIFVVLSFIFHFITFSFRCVIIFFLVSFYFWPCRWNQTAKCVGVVDVVRYACVRWCRCQKLCLNFNGTCYTTYIRTVC